MSDEYQPAITMPTEPEAPAEAAPTPGPAQAAAPDESTDATTVPDDRVPGQRVVSSKVRGMFREIAKKLSAQEPGDTGDDLVPMGAGSPPAAAGAAAAGAAPASPAAPGVPAAATAAPSAAPGMPKLRLPPPVAQPAQPRADDAARAAADQQRSTALEEREKQLAAREAAIGEREKLLPSRDRLAEAPAETLIGWLKDTFGADDNEIKTIAADLMTEVTERVHGTKVPDEIKAQLEGRRALRSVKAVRAKLDADQRSLAEQKAAQERAQREAEEKRVAEARDAEMVNHIAAELAPHAGTFRFLSDPKVTKGLSAGKIVHEVYKEQERLFREGKTTQPPDLDVAARFADDYYKNQAEEAVKVAAHFQSLLAPAAPAAQPAKPQPSPGGAPGPAPTMQPKPVPAPQEQPPAEKDPSDLDYPQEDRSERRRRSLADLKAKYWRKGA